MKLLKEVLDKESYEWLATHLPDVAQAVETEVATGCTPQQIRHFVIVHTGRVELAQRCEAAARHVKLTTDAQ